MDERRRQKRVGLRCHVTFWNPREGTVTKGHTEDISCDGFYGMCGEPYVPGDELQATVEIPCMRLNGHDPSCVVLQCKVEVIRVILNSHADNFGMACRIRQYTAIGLRTASEEVPELSVRV